MSIHTWTFYSIFDTKKINQDFTWTTSYYLSCVMFISFLYWDLYQMLMSTNAKILFKIDVIIHHIFTICCYTFQMNVVPLSHSCLIILESFILMDYIWRNQIEKLRMFRILCILFLRLPLCLFSQFYYIPYVILPVLKSVLPEHTYRYYKLCCNGLYVIILMDFRSLTRMYKGARTVPLKCIKNE
jgi:hypothetical protein